MQWFWDNPWAGWLILAAALAAVETLTLDLTLLMLAAGALAGALVAGVLPDLWWAQAGAAAIVACSMLFFLRPRLLRKFRSAPGYRSQLQRMIGSEAIAMTAITAQGGEIKVNGETWTARTYDRDITIQQGEAVDVFEIDGVTALVHPRNRQLP